MSKAKDSIREIEKLMQAKAVSGLVVIPQGKDHPSLHAIEGKPDDIVANLAYMAYHHPLTLEILRQAVSIATNRLRDDLGPDNKIRQN